MAKFGYPQLRKTNKWEVRVVEVIMNGQITLSAALLCSLWFIFYGLWLHLQ
jgi:uncharacterized membrane protein YccF (DUF307 family)